MEFLRRALMRIPGVHLSDYNATSLCSMGSLQQICCSSVDNIMDATDLTAGA
jgi:hypothetical protein